jgi:DNA-binding LacI/PurR family transcriptional regulator
MLEKRVERPLAERALRAGLRQIVPRPRTLDLSVIGINDVEFAAHLAPPLTTVRLSAEEIGRGAASYLLGRIKGERVITRMAVDFSLIVRGSSGPASRH